MIDDNLIQNVVRDCALYPSASFGACPDTSCSNAVGCHEDGIHIWGVDGGTISRNRLYGVECQAIFFETTNGSLQRNVTIVNNAISSVLRWLREQRHLPEGVGDDRWSDHRVRGNVDDRVQLGVGLLYWTERLWKLLAQRHLPTGRQRYAAVRDQRVG